MARKIDALCSNCGAPFHGLTACMPQVSAATVPGSRRACSCCGGSGWVSFDAGQIDTDAVANMYARSRELLNVAAEIRESYIHTRGTEQEPGWLTDLIESARELNAILAETRGAQCK